MESDISVAEEGRRIRLNTPASTNFVEENNINNNDYERFNAFPNLHLQRSSTSCKSTRSSAKSGTAGLRRTAPHLAIYDQLPTGVSQSEYKTWAQAWISRLSNASIKDRIMPTKYLSTSLPRRHVHGDAPTTQKRLVTGIVRLRSSKVVHTPSIEALAGTSLERDVVNRTQSLRLGERRRILSKYTSFNSPRSSKSPRSSDMSSNLITPATSYIPGTFRFPKEGDVLTETPPKRAENYSLPTRRRYFTFCQPARSVRNQTSATSSCFITEADTAGQTSTTNLNPGSGAFRATALSTSGRQAAATKFKTFSRRSRDITSGDLTSFSFDNVVKNMVSTKNTIVLPNI